MKRKLLIALINWYQACDRTLPGWLARACDRDPVLSEERSMGESLTHSLRQAPKATPSRSPSNLSAKVMRRITEEDYQTERSDAASGFAWIGFLSKAGAVAAACALVAVAFQFWQEPQPGAVERGTGPAVTSTGGATAPEQSIDLPKIDPGALRIDKNWENPLNQEIEYVISDAKGALGFLANSFVPKRYLEDERLFFQEDDQA